MEETIFDRILRRELPAEIVYESEDVLAFRDIQPQAPVHILVIPKQKVANFNEFAEQSVEAMGKLMLGVGNVVRELGLAKGGYRLVVNCGRDGQQTVDYLHVHLLGGRLLKWPPG